MCSLFGRILSAMVLSASFRALAADEPQAVNYRSLGDIIQVGGWTMWVIIGLSILMTFFVIFFVLTFRVGVLYPRRFVREAEDLAEEGQVDALRSLCQENDSMAARIIGAALEDVDGEQRPDYMAVRDALEDEGMRQAGVLWQRIQYLLDIAVISPMVGLLGTVLGMLEAFSGLQVELGVVKPIFLAQGVAKALVTTIGGLIVGIVAMILYAVFRGRLNNLIAGAESACSRVLRRLMVKRGVGRR